MDLGSLRRETKYLVHITFRARRADHTIKNDGMEIAALLQHISKIKPQPAYTSPDGRALSVLIKTTAKAGTIARLLCNGPDEPIPIPGRGPLNKSPLLNEDEFLVIEVGDDAAHQGLGKAATWVQRQ